MTCRWQNVGRVSLIKDPFSALYGFHRVDTLATSIGDIRMVNIESSSAHPFVPASCGRTLFVVFNYIYCSRYLFIVLCFVPFSLLWVYFNDFAADTGLSKLGRVWFRRMQMRFFAYEWKNVLATRLRRMKTSLSLRKRSWELFKKYAPILRD